MRILVIDNTLESKSFGSAPLRRFTWEAKNAEIHTRRGPAADLPKGDRALLSYSHVVISGSLTRVDEESPWVSELLNAILLWHRNKTAVLGVCFGHQMIARALGGIHSNRVADRCELGWTKIETLEKSPLFEGLPEKFYSFSAHHDEVVSVPTGARLIARSGRCAVQAYDFEDRPFYGIQFHPEKNLADTEESITGWIKSGKSKLILEPRKGNQLYNPLVGELIFKNFLNEKLK